MVTSTETVFSTSNWGVLVAVRALKGRSSYQGLGDVGQLDELAELEACAEDIGIAKDIVDVVKAVDAKISGDAGIELQIADLAGHQGSEERDERKASRRHLERCGGDLSFPKKKASDGVPRDELLQKIWIIENVANEKTGRTKTESINDRALQRTAPDRGGEPPPSFLYGILAWEYVKEEG